MEPQCEAYEQETKMMHSLKKDINELRTLDGEKKVLLNNLLDTIHNLERKIVKSPERIKKQLKVLSGKIQRGTDEIGAKKEKFQNDERRLKQLQELQKMIGLRMEEMAHIHHLKNEKHCKSVQEMKRLENMRKEQEKKFKSIKKTHKAKEMELKTKKHQLEALVEEKKTKENSVQVKNKQIETLQREQSRKHTSIRTKISDLDKRIEDQKEGMRMMTANHTKSIQQLLAKYRQLVENVEMYHSNMRQGIESW